MKKYLRDYLYLLAFAGLIVVLDQWAKAIVRAQLELGQTWSPWEWLAPYARIVNWENTGAAFGMGQNLSVIFTILAIIVVGMIVYYFPSIPRRDWPFRVALCMQLGGAVGNLVDRLTQQGRVTDFISVGKFPVFNVADSCISVGVVVLLVGMWIQERQTESTSREDELLSSETEPSLGVDNIQSE
ncbi:MAG: signal peptidase II [Chloroflexota bacterium]|nr:signal peptidase II [Chloroflexota bacterium]